MDYNYKGNNLVFIVGSPRSGTTWLQKLLACHPKVHTGQESDIFDIYIGPQLRAWRRELNPKIRNSGRSAVGLGCYFLEEEFLAMLREYMIKLLEPLVGDLGPDEIFIEKTPSHAMFIPEIMELLPSSRIIHILRDARDVVSSLLAASKSWGAFWAPKTASSAARMWVKHVQAVRKAAQKLSGAQFFELRYEELFADPFNVLSRVVSFFLKLEWSKESIMEAVNRNKFGTYKKNTSGTDIPVRGEFAKISGQVVKDPADFIRKGRPGSWREDLSFKEKLHVWRAVHKAMNEVGYNWPFPM